MGRPRRFVPWGSRGKGKSGEGNAPLAESLERSHAAAGGQTACGDDDDDARGVCIGTKRKAERYGRLYLVGKYNDLL